MSSPASAARLRLPVTFSQSPKYLGIFQRCWQRNRNTPCSQQTRIPYKEQQAPLNSGAIWSHLKPQILNHKASFIIIIIIYFLNSLRLWNLRENLQKNLLKQIFAMDAIWRRRVFLGEGQNSPGPVLTTTDLVSHINKLLFASSI